MGRIMAIDFGQKRCGIAVTDPMQMIANGLKTIRSHEAFDFIKMYLTQEEVTTIVIGEPRDLQNKPSDATKFIEPFVNRLRKAYPDLDIRRYDERFTSSMAFQTMIDAGLSKKKRQDKAMVDTISATLILQSFMGALEQKKR
ncbi:MAG: Holliday junction resolvase RuvX [Bacteroidetes bacterium]|jgi:putative Holliday junction resolvase|nr:Holliday junction resolvase RuvX [Bacteroidota bacterium]MBU1578124.1 Holliday junction resolvase RuvX [Bacteroidota bacterium]MBU2465184.1 Holliday junction resolvase RuvX [Bacteroidota bacterium]MBU2559208.1 Holliday junction resolvase RuvX [Bacteroidota bacterium]MDA3944459.1 Holliday junction resolvase RuvX [Bacteroidota bacterium]